MTSRLTQSAELEIDLEAEAQPNVTYKYSGYATRSDVRLEMGSDPLQPHKANARVLGAKPGDYLIFHLQTTNKDGLKDTKTHRIQVPQPNLPPQGGQQ